jgi:choline dehydrogenase-like flavoprotein
VGSGASGSWAAKELSEHGIEVLLLEAGRAIQPERDYPDAAKRSLLSEPWQRLNAAIYGQHIQARCGSWSQQKKHFFINDRENPYSVSAGSKFLWFRGRQEGGRLHTWGRISPRMSDIDFKASSFDGYGQDWPISYDDLAPYYDHVENFLGLYGAKNGLRILPDGKYIAPWPLTTLEIAFRNAIESKWPRRRVLSARIMRQTSRIPLPLLAAKNSKHCNIRSNAVVKNIEIDPRSGKARGVCFFDRISKEFFTVYSRAVILCASTFESIRILLNSACPQHPYGLGNSSGHLGRGIMDNTLLHRRGKIAKCMNWKPTHKDRYDSSQGVGFFIPQFRNVEKRDVNYMRGFTICGAIGRGNGRWWIASFGSMLPYKMNRLIINKKKKDAFGIPIVHIDFKYHENEWQMLADQKRVTDEILRESGLYQAEWGNTLGERKMLRQLLKRVTFEKGVFFPGSAIHECGGAQMGTNPANSVLNSTNQCWDSPNVFVTDGSCFVTCPAVNLTNTIMAITVRACNRLIRMFKRGEI